MTGLAHSVAATAGRARRGSAARKEEGVDPRQGGAFVLPCEAGVRMRHGSPPGPRKNALPPGFANLLIAERSLAA